MAHYKNKKEKLGATPFNEKERIGINTCVNA
jgi:hypothetical protein